MGSQVLVPFRGSEDCHRHLKLMGDLGQVLYFCSSQITSSEVINSFFLFFFPFMYSTFFSWQIVPMKYNPRDVDSIKAVMAKSNVVINLIGMSNLVQHRIQSQIPS